MHRTAPALLPAKNEDTCGPCFPISFGDPALEDLTRVDPGTAPDRPRADGVPIEVTGTVRSTSGRPLANALLEVWSANHHGRYRHVEDHSGLRPDENHLGMGRVLTDVAGRYRFWAISPGAYLARPDIGRWRPKHIHLSVSGGSARLVTQMYFPDEPNNARDPMAILMGNAFVRNIGRPRDTGGADVTEAYDFDIVVGGQNATLFE